MLAAVDGSSIIGPTLTYEKFALVGLDAHIKRICAQNNMPCLIKKIHLLLAAGGMCAARKQLAIASWALSSVNAKQQVRAYSLRQTILLTTPT